MSRTRTGRAAALVAGALLLTGACSTTGSSGDDAAPAAVNPATTAGGGPPVVRRSPPATPARTRAAGPPAGGVPADVQVDGGDADAVSKAAALTMCLVDTDVDTSDYDALLRTAPLLDRAYFARLDEERPRPVQGGDWGVMASHRAYTTVTEAEQSADLGQPQDNTLEAFRTWTVTVAPVGRDGWRGDTQTTVVFVSLRRDGGDEAWRIVDLREG
ncbi:hypothetical protein ACPA54_25525 [Uniformispora flossi]|uniref:hypothetical protein n=1 Tax=Uniformispora flossi TaxID=3390723 RepID=UPI003C2C84C9